MFLAHFGWIGKINEITIFLFPFPIARFQRRCEPTLMIIYNFINLIYWFMILNMHLIIFLASLLFKSLSSLTLSSEYFPFCSKIHRKKKSSEKGHMNTQHSLQTLQCSISVI